MKKLYSTPKMEILKFENRVTLLCESGVVCLTMESFEDFNNVLEYSGRLD